VATKGFLVQVPYRNIYICKHHSRKSPKKITRKTKDTFMVSGEFWFILEGTDRVQNRGRAHFSGDQRDIVYVPKQTWHRAHHRGTGPSTRLAMNGYPDLLHDYLPNEEFR
jgi:hypothetical protein